MGIILRDLFLSGKNVKELVVFFCVYCRKRLNQKELYSSILHCSDVVCVSLDLKRLKTDGYIERGSFLERLGNSHFSARSRLRKKMNFFLESQ